MAFTGNEGTMIPLSSAAALTQSFRTAFLNGCRERKAVFFGKAKLMEVLNQTDCKGIRCYFGAEMVTHPDGESCAEITLVMVGATADENDMIAETNKILDMGTPCPTNCASANPLNPSTTSTENNLV